MIPDLPSFNRVFEAGDAALFRAASQGLRGLPCVAWRKSYMYSGHLHFGELVPSPVQRPLSVYRDRGTWIITLWDCERRLMLPDGTVYDSRQGEIELVASSLDTVVGDVLIRLEINPVDTTLRLEFQSGTLLELPPDPALGEDAEQWSIEDSTGRALVGYGAGRWALEGPNDTPGSWPAR